MNKSLSNLFYSSGTPEPEPPRILSPDRVFVEPPTTTTTTTTAFETNAKNSPATVAPIRRAVPLHRIAYKMLNTYKE